MRYRPNCNFATYPTPFPLMPLAKGLCKLSVKKKLLESLTEI